MAKSLHKQILSATGTVNEALLDRAIRHAVYLQRYKTGEVNQIVGFLNDDVLPDALARLTTRMSRVASRGMDAGPWTSKRFKDVLAGLDKTLGVGLRKAGAKLREDLAEFAVSEAEYQARAMSGALPAETGIEFSLPSAGQLRSIVTSKPFQGDVLSKHWSRIGAAAKADVARQLRIGLAEGETTEQIVRRISGTKAGKYMDGVFGNLRRNVESTVRTAANHVSTRAREDTYKENDDVVKGVEIVATLDGRTTEICMAEDGKVYDVGEGPRPPLHYNCRTTTVPVLKSWKELGIDLKEAPEGTRASIDGQVPAKLTYGAWLKRQPRAVQDDALGPARAKLFRSGKVKVDRFVDARRRKLTLKELRVREGLEKAPEPKVKKPRVRRMIPEEIKSEKKAEMWGRKNFKAVNYSKSERKAVADYSSGGDYVTINDNLRSGRGVGDPRLDKAMKNPESRLPNDVILYRGVPLHGTAFDVAPESLVGKTFMDPGFMSTTLLRKEGIGFVGDEPGIVFRFKAPKGLHGLFADAVTSDLPMDEWEMLLDRGHKFKIHGVKQIAPGTLLAEAELLPK